MNIPLIAVNLTSGCGTRRLISDNPPFHEIFVGGLKPTDDVRQSMRIQRNAFGLESSGISIICYSSKEKIITGNAWLKSL